jgi:hypothetical protein
MDLHDELDMSKEGRGGDFEVPIIGSQQYRKMLGFTKNSYILIIVKFG